MFIFIDETGTDYRNSMDIVGMSNGDIFNDFIQAQLIPHIMPYNGVNSHSVVILDNCSIHHVPEVIKSIEDVGALLIFLPPYSADLNPIEEMFSKVKYQHKTNALELPNFTDLKTLLLSSFASITREDCISYILIIVVLIDYQSVNH